MVRVVLLLMAFLNLNTDVCYVLVEKMLLEGEKVHKEEKITYSGGVLVGYGPGRALEFNAGQAGWLGGERSKLHTDEGTLSLL